MNMCELSRADAVKEIYKTFYLCNFFTRRIGYNFIDKLPNTMFGHLKRFVLYTSSLLMSFVAICSDIIYLYSLLNKTSSVAEYASNLHLVGYDVISYSKLLTIWYKSNTLRRLINELPDFWTILIQGEDMNVNKQKRIRSLRRIQFSYMLMNILGLVMYSMRPVFTYLYHTMQSTPVELGTVWHVPYPFEITSPVFRLIFFLLETYAGALPLCCMLGYDILFMTMTDHVTMLLSLLKTRIRRIGYNNEAVGTSDNRLQQYDCYEEIISVVKIHQRLIKFMNDLEITFSGVNLVNILLSSINICCVFFNIILDPWLALDNKIFLGSALTQVGIICWYADELYTSSTGVAEAVYECAWYKCNRRSQQALLILLQRSQKPLYYTALKFHSITLSTYTSILTSSYSYFTLLYTLYHNN